MDGSMRGKIVIVTGSNAGIGKATAAAIADRGARVILACRNAERGQAALAELRRVRGRKLELMMLDLADLDSVRAFAAAFSARYSRLDVLVNNAGVLARRRTETKQGFEQQFGVNYLGHFLLTLLLLPLLERAPQGRIVMLSSVAHGWNDLPFDDLQSEKHYGRFSAYGYSKLCNLLFTRALAKRLRARGSRVTINAAHPGIVASDIIIKRPDNSFRWVAVLMRAVFISPEKGARTSIFLACDPSVSAVSGEYFYRCRIHPSSAASNNADTAERLYALSLGYAGLDADPAQRTLPASAGSGPLPRL